MGSLLLSTSGFG